MLELSALNALLPHIASEIETIRENDEKLAKADAHRFDPFVYLRTNELGMCRIICDLLRPNGDHGQGALFLKLFLTMLGLSTAGSEHARVVPETPTTETDENRRRIDIYIELDDGRIIAMEAKPFAQESPDQLKNMIDHAEKLAECRAGGRVDAAYAVFLTPDGREPDSIPCGRMRQLRADGRLILRRFNSDGDDQPNGAGSIRTWVDCCAATVSVERLRWFLREFSRHLTHLFPANLHTRGQRTVDVQGKIVCAVLSRSRQERLAAFYIAYGLDALREQSWLSFVKSIADRLSSIDKNFEIVGLDSMLKDPALAPRGFTNFVWRRPDWPSGSGIALQIQFTGRIKDDAMEFGFTAPSTRVPREQLVGWGGIRVGDSSWTAISNSAKTLLTAAFGKVGNVGRYRDWWPILVTLQNPLNRPFTPEGLAAITDPATTDNFVECFRALYEATKDLSIEAA
jgi:hypothetical protein